jgi:hypothetical protein
MPYGEHLTHDKRLYYGLLKHQTKKSPNRS